ncbi:SOS response-associated peptidase family protein [Rhodococcus aetherivorans]|uniref:SOS response-associated peptidase family protein n=1 Tax=Rhodococcus TaxID=1827 RepID=UPI0009E1AA36|nr:MULTISPECIES: SOS response-associated peptidase family protein [Rhodococcus]
MRWGPVPSFATEIVRSATLFNARPESAALEPAFARPVRHRRCLVPTDGWYEWQHDPSSADGRAGPAGKAGWAGRIPYCMSPRDGSRHCTAGLWSRWSDPKSSREAVVSITIRRRPRSAASATTVPDCSPRPRPPPSSSPCSDARRRIRPRW